MDMTPQRWENTCAYLQEVFGGQDADLAGLRDRAIAQGLPDIAVSPDVGRLLMILTTLAGRDGRGASLALEVGTLAGCSAIWIARGLSPEGRLITIEIDNHHAGVARSEFERAGVADRIETVRGAALGMRVTLVCPGVVRTEFQGVAGYDPEAFGAFMERIGPVLEPRDIANLVGCVCGQPAHVHDIVIRPTRQEYP